MVDRAQILAKCYNSHQAVMPALRDWIATEHERLDRQRWRNAHEVLNEIVACVQLDQFRHMLPPLKRRQKILLQEDRGHFFVRPHAFEAGDAAAPECHGARKARQMLVDAFGLMLPQLQLGLGRQCRAVGHSPGARSVRHMPEAEGRSPPSA